MYMLINALLIALLVLPLGANRKVDDGPSCHARLTGTELVTRVELLSGISVEGPWRVVRHDSESADLPGAVMYARLDYVVETDALTGERVLIRFPEPVRVAFQGSDEEALIRRAAQTWCVTVMRAQHQRMLQRNLPNEHGQSWIAET